MEFVAELWDMNFVLFDEPKLFSYALKNTLRNMFSCVCPLMFARKILS